MITLSLPFQRGTTGYAGDSIDTNNLRFAAQLGQVRGFTDVNPTSKVVNSNLNGLMVMLRNKHSDVLLPKQAIRFSTTVIGESGAPVSALSQLFAIVDEYLPAAGVPVNDCFWAVIGGPTTALMVTVSGAKSAGQLPVQSSTTSGKLDFTDLAPGSDAIGQAAGGYGYNAFTLGALADGATEARILINRSFYGQNG
jgi:hypothetical protein